MGIRATAGSAAGIPRNLENGSIFRRLQPSWLTLQNRSNGEGGGGPF